MGGGDKARIEIGGVSILDRVLATLSAQCTGIIINANGDPKRFADTGLTVVPDSIPNFAGPLAGILAGLDWLAKQGRGIEWILSVPGDCPFLPDDLVERLHQSRRKMGAGVPLACARSGEWRHPRGGPMAADTARGLAQGVGQGRPAQDRDLDRAAWRRNRRLARSTDRSVL
jgi:molybdopterin-guanine dinucleotide biosynthesis protein A